MIHLTLLRKSVVRKTRWMILFKLIHKWFEKPQKRQDLDCSQQDPDALMVGAVGVITSILSKIAVKA
jgi:hypothetical protein